MSEHYKPTRDWQQDLEQIYGAGHLHVHETPQFEEWEDGRWFNPPKDLKSQILTRAEFNAKYGTNTEQFEDVGVKPGAV